MVVAAHAGRAQPGPGLAPQGEPPDRLAARAALPPAGFFFSFPVRLAARVRPAGRQSLAPPPGGPAAGAGRPRTPRSPGRVAHRAQPRAWARNASGRPLSPHPGVPRHPPPPLPSALPTATVATALSPSSRPLSPLSTSQPSSSVPSATRPSASSSPAWASPPCLAMTSTNSTKSEHAFFFFFFRPGRREGVDRPCAAGLGAPGPPPRPPASTALRRSRPGRAGLGTWPSIGHRVTFICRGLPSPTAGRASPLTHCRRPLSLPPPTLNHSFAHPPSPLSPSLPSQPPRRQVGRRRHRPVRRVRVPHQVCRPDPQL